MVVLFLKVTIELCEPLFFFFFYRLHMEVKQNMYLGRGDVVCGTCQERITLKSGFCYLLFILDLKEYGF